MAEAKTVKPIVAEIPPHTQPRGGSAADGYKTLSGFEGREEELGRSLNVILKMLGNHAGYAHEINDPLVKAHLMAIQFAKDQGRLADYVAHDVRTMEPINLRMRQLIAKFNNPELALIGLFDRTACHYALALDSHGEGLSRSWHSPFGRVLEACRKLGQFDLTEQEIHAQWTVPRLTGYGETMGIKLMVTPWSEDGLITCTVHT